MEIKKILFACAAFLSVFVSATEAERNQNLRVIIEKTYLGLNNSSFFNVLAAEAIVSSQKNLDIDLLMEKFQDSLEDEETFARLVQSYSSFTDEEISELRKIQENPVFEKYSNSGNLVQMTVQKMKELLKEIVEREGIEEKENCRIEVIEITKDNFQTEVFDSQNLVVIDVYSKNCPPCRLMEPVIEGLSRHYEGKVRFVKLDAEAEQEMIEQLGITLLPTFLFINPEEKTIFLKITGFTTKKDFQSKIEEFLSPTD